MAKRRRRKGKLNIQHFRGLHEFPPADERTFTRYINGLIDDPAGDLARLGGKVCFGSNPLGSVWSINQVRFKGNWGIVVQNTSNRIWYDHNPYKGPEDGFIEPAGPDAQVTIIPGHIVPGDKDGDPVEPGIVPGINCHSDLEFRAGIFVLPVTDLMICQRQRASATWVGVAGWNASLADAFDASWNIVLFTPAYWTWSSWTRYAVGAAGLVGPYFRVFVNVAVPAGTPLYNVKFMFRQVEHRPCSDTLANPPSTPWGGDYDNAEFSSNGVFFSNLSDYIGDPDAACTGHTCAQLSTPIVDGGIDPMAAVAASRALISTFSETVAGAYTDVLGTQNPTWDSGDMKLELFAEGGFFSSVWSHFES